MSLRKTTRHGHGTLNELNITPLLDLVFVLLVIFILTTPSMINHLDISLPSGKPPVSPVMDSPPKITQVRIEATGQILLNGQEVAPTLLSDQLRRLKSAQGELRVVVKASNGVEYQNLVNVLDTLQRLEITKVGLATASPTRL